MTTFIINKLKFREMVIITESYRIFRADQKVITTG